MAYAKHVTDEVTGLEKVQLRTSGGTSAEVFLHGAHCTSFKPSSSEEVIFVSKQAVFDPPKAIRGGIPVCWPQFNDMGPGSAHGFVRNSQFQVASLAGSKTVLRLCSSDDTKEAFPHEFEFRVTVEVTDEEGGTLHQKVDVDNKSAEAWKTTQALHTYYRVSDVDNISVGNLKVDYLDNADERKCKSDSEADVKIDKLVNRIYKTEGCELHIDDRGAPNRRIVLQTCGFSDAVLWNPWDTAANISDLGDEEYRSMVCLEPANAALYMDGKSIEVGPGATWSASQKIRVEAL